MKSKTISKNILRSKIKPPKKPVEEIFLDFPDIPGKKESSPTQGEDDVPVTNTKYEDRYVCFIDILGFKELIAASAREVPGIEPSMIFSALDIRHDSVKDSFFNLLNIQSPEDPDNDLLRVHSFSDCVVASCPKNPHGLALLMFFCWQISSDWLSKSFLSRGGIACGKLLHKLNDGGAPLIFGPAFIQAYKLESEIADFPRIVFSKEVRQAYLEIESNTAPEQSQLRIITKALITKFDDGPTGIDIFSHLRADGLDTSSQSFKEDAEQYKNALINHKHEACDTPHFFKKIHWLVERFNKAILQSKYADKHIKE